MINARFGGLQSETIKLLQERSEIGMCHGQKKRKSISAKFGKLSYSSQPEMSDENKGVGVCTMREAKL